MMFLVIFIPEPKSNIITEGRDIYVGFPFHYILIMTFMGKIWEIRTFWPGLLIDLILYYFVSCLIIWKYAKSRGKTPMSKF